MPDSARPAMLVTSRALASMPYLENLVGAQIHYAWPWTGKRAAAVLAWGNKPSADKALALASRLGAPLIRLEDGFLRSLGHGNGFPAYSLVTDRLGIYYDASSASDLEYLIKTPRDDTEHARARALLDLWRSAYVSKYNHARDAGRFLEMHHLGDRDRPFVLVADQTRDDASVRYGLAGEASFRKMLGAALEEYPDHQVVLKLHPEVACGRKKGYFEGIDCAATKRLILMKEDLHPALLLEQAAAVYTVTSQLGFEGLIWGKPVRTFGMPFYAGWGLTRDELERPARRCAIVLENLVYATLIDYARYVDPETGKACRAERLIEWMHFQRKMRERFPEKLTAVGIPLYKRRVLRNYFAGSEMRFRRRCPETDAETPLVRWGKNVQEADSFPGTIRVEDGFMRSVGLGADLVSPLSLILDGTGIHYDPNSPSELETILQTRFFDRALLERAKNLCEKIVVAGITKYNLGPEQHAAWTNRVRDVRSQKRCVILVPGQVETDASVRLGAVSIRTNSELLRAVRSANPQAYLIYKPHPDVIAGLRKKGKDEQLAAQWCDLMVNDASAAELFPWIDEVHTLTSLTGFEALLREKSVVCYGQPFYAGWGLTRDIHPLAHRTRRLSILELVAGALILYPTYISRTSKAFTTPERAVDELLMWRERAQAESRFRAPLRMLLRLRKY